MRQLRKSPRRCMCSVHVWRASPATAEGDSLRKLKEEFPCTLDAWLSTFGSRSEGTKSVQPCLKEASTSAPKTSEDQAVILDSYRQQEAFCSAEVQRATSVDTQGEFGSPAAKSQISGPVSSQMSTQGTVPQRAFKKSQAQVPGRVGCQQAGQGECGCSGRNAGEFDTVNVALSAVMSTGQLELSPESSNKIRREEPDVCEASNKHVKRRKPGLMELLRGFDKSFNKRSSQGKLSL